jgi:hypothetical protein
MGGLNMRRFLVLAVMLPIAGGILRIVIQDWGLPELILPREVAAATRRAEVHHPNVSGIDGWRQNTVPELAAVPGLVSVRTRKSEVRTVDPSERYLERPLFSGREKDCV